MTTRITVYARPCLESLESRLVQSGGFPANTIGTGTGLIATPGEVTAVSVTVAPKNLTPGKHSTIFGIFAQPTSGSGLHPRIVSVEEAGGVKVPFKQGRPFLQGYNDQVAGFVKVNRPGPLTIVVSGSRHTTGSYLVEATLAGDVNGDGVVNQLDLSLFAAAYESKRGEPAYNAAADFNQNGRVNLYDAMALMHNLAPESARKPLQAVVNLNPSDQTPLPTSVNSGGETYKKNVTIQGYTTPGSLVLTDSYKTETYTFAAKAYVASSTGFFSIPTSNTAGLNNNDLLILDPFGHKLIRSYPIFWNAFAQPHSKIK